MFIGHAREWTKSTPCPTCKHYTFHIPLLSVHVQIIASIRSHELHRATSDLSVRSEVHAAVNL